MMTRKRSVTMNVYSRLNKETEMYRVYIAMVGFEALIPQKEYEKCTTDKQRVIMCIEHSNSDFSVWEQDAIDPDKYKPLAIYTGKDTPETGEEFLGYLRGIHGYDLKTYPYLTMGYNGKIAIHKNYPEWRDDYWYSEGREYIGYFPSEVFADNEGEDCIDYMVDHVFKVI